MDGTFEYCTKFFGQLFTILALCDDVYVPVVFCLLKNKAISTYLNLLHILKEKCDLMGCVLNPKTVVIDFEIAVHLSVEEVWQETQIIGCRFHLAQSWWRKIQQLGLASEYKNQQSPIGNWLNHLFGLTFLPPTEVGECFAQDFMSDKPQDSKVDQFTDYLVDTYIDSDSKFPPEIWADNSCNIFRTTKTCESFHSKFKRENLSPYPNIHSFVKVLTEMQTDTSIKLNSIKRHEKKYIRRETLLKQQFIQSKIMQLNRHEISRYNFVKCVSYKFVSVVNL
nr:unnamed protein product [Callosobruchus analis]